MSSCATEAALPASNKATLIAAMELERRRKEHGDPTPSGLDAVPAFITISRQAGIDAHAAANALCEYLNARCPTGPRWTVWDRYRLAAAAAHFSPEGSLSGSTLRWCQEYFGSTDRPATSEEDLKERRMAQLVRLLARAGHVVLIGFASVYATHDLPTGAHVRLVAPLPDRVAAVTAGSRLVAYDAEAEVRRVDRERESTHRRFCAGASLRHDYFTLTLNTSGLAPARVAACILPLVPDSNGGDVPRLGPTANADLARPENQNARSHAVA
jgi:hypothetical protein